MNLAFGELPIVVAAKFLLQNIFLKDPFSRFDSLENFQDGSHFIVENYIKQIENFPQLFSGSHGFNSRNRLKFQRLLDSLYQYTLSTEEYCDMRDALIAAILFDETYHLGRSRFQISKRYVNHKFELCENLLGFESVPGSMNGKTCAETIMRVLSTAMPNSYGYMSPETPTEAPSTIIRDPVRACGADRCQTNFGHTKGCIKRIQEEGGMSLWALQCAAHRASTASHRAFTAKTAARSCAWFQSLIEIPPIS